jgi:putative chitinase
MSLVITEDKFKQLFPKCKDPAGWVAVMQLTLPNYQIDTKQRLASFLAQCGHESAGWTVFSENLNYSADGLLKVFGKYFPSEADAIRYARQPVAIANKVYGGRMGNGGEASGDGWKYRGRGPVQCTGRNNYTTFSKEIYGDTRIVDNPDLVTEDKGVGLMAAVWFWSKNNLNKYADKGDVIGMTKVINGGHHGLADRQARYDLAMKIL